MTEAEYWALAPQAREAGVVKSRMGQLAKLCNDYSRAYSILQAAIRTKNASAYLGKVISNLKEEVALEPINISNKQRKEEPDVVVRARLRLWPVRKITRSNGTPGWFVDGILYDQGGVDVGA